MMNGKMERIRIYFLRKCRMGGREGGKKITSRTLISGERTIVIMKFNRKLLFLLSIFFFLLAVCCVQKES